RPDRTRSAARLRRAAFAQDAVSNSRQARETSLTLSALYGRTSCPGQPERPGAWRAPVRVAARRLAAFAPAGLRTTARRQERAAPAGAAVCCPRIRGAIAWAGGRAGDVARRAGPARKGEARAGSRSCHSEAGC